MGYHERQKIEAEEYSRMRYQQIESMYIEDLKAKIECLQKQIEDKVLYIVLRIYWDCGFEKVIVDKIFRTSQEAYKYACTETLKTIQEYCVIDSESKNTEVYTAEQIWSEKKLDLLNNIYEEEIYATKYDGGYESLQVCVA